MNCLSTAVGAICPRLLQMVKTDTGKAGIGHRKTFKNDKEEAIDPLFNSKDYIIGTKSTF